MSPEANDEDLDGIRHIPISEGNGRQEPGDGADGNGGGPEGDEPLRSATELADERAAAMLKRAEAGEPGDDEAAAEALPPAAELMEKLKRVKADFANYQRRMGSERENWVASGKRAVLSALLPALDALEITASSADEHEDYEGLRSAVRLVKSEAEKFLGVAGVERVRALGETFDPEIHEALFSKPTDDVEPGIVIEEVRPGFMLGEMVVRPSQVVVSAARSGEVARRGAEGDEGGEGAEGSEGSEGELDNGARSGEDAAGED